MAVYLTVVGEDLKKGWFTAKAGAGGKTAELSIYDEIGIWGISAKAFIQALRDLGDVDEIRLDINSPGGDVFDGLAIYNALKQHKAAVHVTVQGIAASMASVVAMAGDTVTMPANAFMMIHNPFSLVVGDAEELREWADVLDKLEASLAGVYVGKTGLADAKVRDLMAAQTWLTAAEAEEAGFADKVIAETKAAARFDLSRYSAAPKGATEIVAVATDAGAGGDSVLDAPRETRSETMTVKPSGEQPNGNEPGTPAAPAATAAPAPGTEAAGAVDAARAEGAKTARAITELVALAGGSLADANKFLAEGKSVDDVRAALLAKRDAGTDTHDNAVRGQHMPAPERGSLAARMAARFKKGRD